MGQYLSACLSSDATDDDAYDRRDIEFLEEQAQRILDLQCRVNEIAQPPQVLKKSSYKPDQIVTLVDGREVVIVDGKIFGGGKYSGPSIKIYEPLGEPSEEGPREHTGVVVTILCEQIRGHVSEDAARASKGLRPKKELAKASKAVKAALAARESASSPPPPAPAQPKFSLCVATRAPVSGDDERIFAVVQSRGGSWDREDRGGPFGVAYFPSITEAQAAAKILLKDDAVRAVDAGSRYNHLF
jgi:hypothetical protein